MIDIKETLKKLHKKFPLISLDELFDILDCYTEMITEPKIWYTDYKIPIKTNGVEINKNSISCSTNNKMDDRNTITTTDFGSQQFTTSY